MDAISELALEAVAVEEGEKELEILLFAVVGSCGKEKELACVGREELT